MRQDANTTDPSVFRSGLEPLLRVLVQKNGSDLYLSANNPPMVRINGYCVPISSRPLAPQTPWEMLQSLPGQSSVETGPAPGQTAQFAVTVPHCGRFRVQTYFQSGTLALAIRHLPLAIPALQDSSLPPVLRKLAMATSGLVLLVGPSGSGKSTTAASMLDFRNSQVSGHILTLEDPIEFVFSYQKSVFNQIEVGVGSHHWQDSIRLALRHRSDVVYLSDIQDAEGMTAAMDLAQGGALCIATLVAPDCEQAIERVLAFYPFAERPAIQRKLAKSLKAVVAQKLMRTQQGQHHPVCEILPHSLRVAEIIRQGDLHDIGVVLQQSDAQRGQSFEMDIARLHGLGVSIAPEGQQEEEPSAEVWKTSRFGLQSEFKASGQLSEAQAPPISLALGS
jgi:twitching motility protein PilU